jgi:hypothetical protein
LLYRERRFLGIGTGKRESETAGCPVLRATGRFVALRFPALPSPQAPRGRLRGRTPASNNAASETNSIVPRPCAILAVYRGPSLARVGIVRCWSSTQPSRPVRLCAQHDPGQWLEGGSEVHSQSRWVISSILARPQGSGQPGADRIARAVSSCRPLQGQTHAASFPHVLRHSIAERTERSECRAFGLGGVNHEGKGYRLQDASQGKISGAFSTSRCPRKPLCANAQRHSRPPPPAAGLGPA